MKDWKYTFESVSKAEWLAQIEKDLKGKPLDTLQSEWWPGELLIPFHHQEDLENQVITLPEEFFQQPPLLMEWIETFQLDNTTIREKIRSALNYGTQSIVFDIGKNKQPEFDFWYKDVIPDMIQTGLIVNSDFDVNASQVVEQLPFNTYIRLQRGDEPSVKFVKSALTTESGSNIPFRFSYKIPSKGKWTDEVVIVFKKIFNDLAEWNSKGKDKNDFLQKCIIEIEPDEYYFKQIIQTRVLQIAWLNFSAFLSDQTIIASPVECHIHPIAQIDPDKYLVRASSSGLAASLTGVNTICIHQLNNGDVPKYYERINRGIHHLLNLESEMYKGLDPLAGAYTFDYYTWNWSKYIWERLSGINSL